MELPERQIVGVDVDGTLTKEVCWTPGDCLAAKPELDQIARVNRLESKNVVIIYTARRANLLEATVNWLDKHGVKYHAISIKKIPLNLYFDEDAHKLSEIEPEDKKLF